MFDRGWLTVSHFKGAPVRIHWSAPLGALLFGGFRFAPAIWLAFVVIVLVHELGHAVLVRRFRLRLVAVDVYAMGGMCRHERGSAYQTSVIAWGGVLAQGVLLAPALALSIAASTLALPIDGFAAELLSALVYTNVFIILFNLIPIAPLDGAQAWKVFSHLKERRARDRARGARDRVKVELRRGDKLDVAGVDEDAVRETVRRALMDARRQSGPPKN